MLVPTQTLTFLGFILDSVKMTLSPTPEKIDKIVKACRQMVQKATPLILDVARVIGLIVSLFPGAEYGPLHYRVLEHDKINAIAANAGDFNMPMELSEASIQELLWWITYAPRAQKHICYPTPSMIIQADASKKGWGGAVDGRKIGRRWTPSEASKHINLLELQAAFFGLKSFADHTRGIHIQLQLDNTTAVAYVNNMGGSKSLKLDQLAKDLWG